MTDSFHSALIRLFLIASASLFGWSGKQATKTAEEILHEVRGLISRAKNELRLEFAQADLLDMMDHIDVASVHAEKWNLIPGQFRDRFRSVFSTCWDNGPGCATWRVQEVATDGVDGGAKAVLLALKFSELMIHSGATLIERGLMTEFFANDTVKAADLTLDHVIAYKNERVKFGSARGLKVGSHERLHPHYPERPNCGWLYHGYKCPDYFLKDEFRGGIKVCDYPVARCDSYANGCNAAEIVLEQRMNTCREAQKVLIREELETLELEARQAAQTARSLRAGFWRQGSIGSISFR